MATSGRFLALNPRPFFNFPAKQFHSTGVSNLPKRWTGKSQPPFQQELKNPVEVVYGGAEKWPKDVFGKLYDKKPFLVSVKKYHLYKWCGCGWSHSQPFCDETCSDTYYKKVIVGGPITYIAPEDRDVWFCNCKRTQHRPFCDGSHRKAEIQETRIDAKFDLWEPKAKDGGVTFKSKSADYLDDEQLEEASLSSEVTEVSKK